MMHAEQKVDVFGFVSKIREQRSQLIQTDVSWKYDKFQLPTLERQPHDTTLILDLMSELSV